MNFITFGVGTTNIFPQANSKVGGQLMTEYNLRSRESINSPEVVKYMIGPSYVHSSTDFEVRIQTDGAGTQISTSTIEIMPGRGIVDGFFIESLVSVTVDLLEANAKAKSEGDKPLKGELSIGLRVMYSTEETMAGSLRVENQFDMNEGIQVVVLPKEEFILPVDSPDDLSKVTAHLKLADFVFVNGAITTLINNYPDKCKNVSADRIANVDRLLSDVYVRKTGLNPRKLYSFSGKGTDPSTGLDTWCDTTGSLMIWDHNPQSNYNKPSVLEAQFGINSNGKTQLVVPHRQVDGMSDKSGKAEYYQPRVLDLPLADFTANTPGTVDSRYTNNIKRIQETINNVYRLPGGKQRGYKDILQKREDLPTFNPAWSIGDYILVGTDNTLDSSSLTTDVKSPSTMYVVVPGVVTKTKFLQSIEEDSKIPASLTGMEIHRDEIKAGSVANKPNTSDPDIYNTELGISTSNYRGQPKVDYFTVVYTEYITVTEGDKEVEKEKVTYYYYAVELAEPNGYSEPVMVTGSIPYAQESVIGGFRNVPETALDLGYVFRDENGNLRLLDYGLLRSGTLAYQLGEDIEIPGGLTTEEVQVQLDEYVNNRVAFPNSKQLEDSEHPNVINITIDLSEEETPVTLNIGNIDSRFGTSICLHIKGTANSKTTINIHDCEKVRLDNTVGGTPIINLYRCGIYYDAATLDRIAAIQDMKLWYERYEKSDPNLLVDDMTVREVDAPIVPDEIDFWNTKLPNDNHYMYALQSLTFAGDGTIIGCGLYVKNETSANIALGECIIASKFTIPQGGGLMYPISCLTKRLKVTGTFVTSYSSSNPAGYIVMDTNFTAMSQVYDEFSVEPTLDGEIVFHVNATLVKSVFGIDPGQVIEGWRHDSFHTFQGSVIG